jgi:hypothetical protein
MKRFSLSLAVFAIASIAHGGVVAIPPAGPARVANADAVIVGKVQAIEPQDVKAGTTTYRIAVVKIEDGIKGTKEGAKTLRVGFIPLPKPNPMVIVSGARPVQLEVGKEGLFLLSKQKDADFYVIGGVVGFYINSDKNKDFEKEVATAKMSAKIAANPQGALKAKDKEERLVAVALLIEKYRTFRPKAKEEPIDADESKQILQALADTDWQAQIDFTALRPNPAQLFRQLSVTAKDGFVPPMSGDLRMVAPQWLRENTEKYRIKRFAVADGK